MAGDLYGDYSRVSFDAERAIASLLSQQGRVILDSELNEQAAIVLDAIRGLARDTIGQFGGPYHDPANAAGHGPLLVALAKLDNGKPDVTIAPGRYYVGGIRIDLVARPPATVGASYYAQPDAWYMSGNDPLPPAPYLVYLRVWEHNVTGIEDPRFREIALGMNGPDTAARQRVVWQLLATRKLPWDPATELGEVPDLDAFLDGWQLTDDRLARPRLMARSQQPPGTDTEPCATPPSSRYRGIENQLYRVEIHRGGPADEATFKWSRDNGSSIHPLESLLGETARVTSLGRDRRSSLEIGDWVEIVDDRTAVRAPRQDDPWQPSPLRLVMDVDTIERTVTLDAVPEAADAFDLDRHPFLRRWDQRTGPSSGLAKGGAARPTAASPEDGLDISSTGEDGWLDLEDGVQIRFASPQGGVPPRYRSGDFWLIPARTATGNVDWPGDLLDSSLPPLGIDYAYAPLAIVRTDGTIGDLRSLFASSAVRVGA